MALGIKSKRNSYQQIFRHTARTAHQFNLTFVFKIVSGVKWGINHSCNMRKTTRIIGGMPVSGVRLCIERHYYIALCDIYVECVVYRVCRNWPEV